MAYRDAVEYIEGMNPRFVRAVAEELQHVARALSTVLPDVSALPGRVEWDSAAADLCEQRLQESIDLGEGLHDGFAKAGAAVSDYADAQRSAMDLVADGAAAERSLGDLIAGIVATQSLVVRLSDPLRQWNDLRSTTGATDFIIELSQRGAIDEVRDEAEALWQRATTAYDDALRVEGKARTDVLAQLDSAYWMLPDFLANSELAFEVIDGVPGVFDASTPAPMPVDQPPYQIGPPTRPELPFTTDFPHDPNAQATPEDYLRWNKWKMMLKGSQVARSDLDDANATYAHYLEGLGTPMEIDFEEAYAEDSAVQEAVDAEIRRAQEEVQRLYQETGLARFETSGGPIQASNLIGTYPAATENWQKTIGDYVLWGSAQVVIEDGQATMRITVHMEDYYDFNRGAADIETGIADEENGRFATLGWAAPFHTSGSLERTVTWPLDEGPGGELGGGDDPERDAPGEDRVDGRESG